MRGGLERRRDAARRRVRLIGRLGLAALAAIGPARAAEPERTYAVGKSGWALERFGRDVAVLRTDLVETPHGPPGSLILSCEAGLGRLSLIFPRSVRADEAGLAAAGTLLIRPVGPSVAGFSPVLARTTGARPGSLVVAEDRTSRERPVLAITRILAARPNGFDVLLHVGPGAVTLGRTTPWHILVFSRDIDQIAFRDFATTCEYRAPRP